MKKYIIVAGGTGGHIIPALAVYELLKEKGYKLKFVCRKKDFYIVEQLKEIEEDTIKLWGRGFPRKLTIKNFFSFLTLILNCFISFFYILLYQPDGILAFGGYITFPWLASALIFHKKIYLFEQNSIPGIVNRIFYKYAEKVFVNFEYTKKFFPSAVVLGNPVKKELQKKMPVKKARESFGFKNKKPVLLVMGGSQGAEVINKTVAQIINEIKNLNILWLTGKRNYPFYKKYASKNVCVIDYTTEMNRVYSASDIAITRAGAMSLTELAYYGIPAILIPLKIATENHQLINAKIYEELGGVYIIEEDNLNKEKLKKMLNQLLKNRKKMSSQIRRAYKFNSRFIDL